MENIYTIKVAFGDTDAAGIVFYPNFYRWMDQATHDLIGNRVMPVSRLLNEENIVIPLLETHCNFYKPLLFEDIVEVRSTVTEINNKTFKIQHDYYKDNQQVASGYEVRAWTSKLDGKLKAVPISEDLREKLMSN